MNKKTYQAPATTCIVIGHESILAASANDLIMNTGGDAPNIETGEEFSREDHPSNPNVWDQGW